MKTKQYTNPQEAYDLMNQWTRIKTSYETQFHGKDVTRVDITFEGDQPRFAAVHCRTNTQTGVENIDLSQKILLDQPEKPAVDFVKKDI